MRISAIVILSILMIKLKAMLASLLASLATLTGAVRSDVPNG